VTRWVALSGRDCDSFDGLIVNWREAAERRLTTAPVIGPLDPGEDPFAAKTKTPRERSDLTARARWPFRYMDGGVDKKRPDPMSGRLTSAVNYRLLVGTLDHGR